MLRPDNIPAHFFPLPEGHVLLGRGGHIREHLDGIYHIYAIDQEPEIARLWRHGLWAITNDDGLCYACPIDHPLVDANRENVERLNPSIVFPWMNHETTSEIAPDGPLSAPESLPPLPDRAIYIGTGGSFTPTTNFAGWFYNPDRHFHWHEARALGGTRSDIHFAVSPDSPILDLNPHLRPQAAPEPAEVRETTTFGRRQWILTLNNTPVSSLSELENLCSHLISKPENLTPLTECLWKALEYDNPEARIESWATREPLLLMVDFLPDKSEADVLIPTIAESSKSIGEIITTAAAGVLLRGGLSNHFNYTEEGRLIINPANPPDLEQGCEILRRTLEVRETGQKLDNYSAWTLGMLGDELERFFGDRFDPSLVMEATGRCYNTYITSLKVYRELWANRRNLSFTHHKEALYAKVPIDDTHFILDTADRLKLSVAQQRKLVSFVRLYGRASFEEDPPQDAELLMERLDVKSVNKNYLFFLRSENKWFKYRGPFEHIPNGASPIINADTRAVLAVDGTPTEMAEWTPVGIEVPYLRGRAATVEAERATEVESTQEARDAEDPIEEEVA